MALRSFARSSKTSIVVLAWLALFAVPMTEHCAAQSVVRVRTTSIPRGVWLHEHAAATPWVALCAAPCETALTRGAELGLSLDGLAVRATPTLTLENDAVLQLRFDDHHLTRTYGLIVTVLGIVGALTLGLGGVSAWASAGGQGDMTGPITAMASAAGVLALGLGVGIVLMNEGDRVEITVAP